MGKVSDILKGNASFIRMQTEANNDAKYVLEFVNNAIRVVKNQGNANNSLKKIDLSEPAKCIKASNGNSINNTYVVIKMDDSVEYLEFLNGRLPHGKFRDATLEINRTLDYDVLCILGALKYINYLPENIVDIMRVSNGGSSGRGKGVQIDVYYNDYAVELLRYVIELVVKNSTTKRESNTVPILVRQAVYAVMYSTLSAIHSKSFDYNVVKNNRRRFINLNYANSLFDRIDLRRKSFNSWGIYPIQDYKNEMTEPVLLKVYRNGKKRDDLLFTLSRLINDSYPRRLMDVFGGTGVVTAALPEKKVEILNEFDPFTFNFLECVQKDAKKVLAICRNMHTELLDIDKDPKNAKWIKSGQDRLLEVLEDLENTKADYGYTQDYSDFFIKYQAFTYKLLDDFVKNNYSRNVMDCKAIQNEDLLFRYAAIWYFLHSFKGSSVSNDLDINGFTMSNYPKYLAKLGFINLQGEDLKDKGGFVLKKFEDGYEAKYYTESIPNSIIENPTLFNQPIAGASEGDYRITDDVELIRYGKRLKHVSLRNDSFEAILAEADKYATTGMGVVEDETKVKTRQSILATPEQTVVYLDPPYFLTAQYNNPFPDSYHMIMLGWMRNTKCRWVMSCKETVTNTSSKQGYRYGNNPNAPLIESFKTYFEILGYGYKEVIIKGKKYYVKNDDNELMDGLYVYKNNIIKEDGQNGEWIVKDITSEEDKKGKDKNYGEIMIANFPIEEVTCENFILYWSKSLQSSASREKKADVELYKGISFFKREDYIDFLARL